MFAVVEDHERLFVGEEREDLGGLVACGEVQSEAVGDRCGHVGTVAHGGEVNEPHAASVVDEFGFADGDSEAGLA